jgi:hypothetical protein
MSACTDPTEEKTLMKSYMPLLLVVICLALSGPTAFGKQSGDPDSVAKERCRQQFLPLVESTIEFTSYVWPGKG